MQFLYPALTVGFFLALVPPLIHLINMMRHRRVQWAAMEFLLQSYKKHRKWVWLRQLLLLLARVAVVLLIVAMLAQLVTQRRYEGLFGNTLTHHYVLLDDSMSMSDRAGGSDALQRGLQFVRQLGSEASKQEFSQRFTLIRFSRAAAGSQRAADQQSGESPPVADFNAEDVDSEFPVQMEQLRNTIVPTDLPVGPEAALEVARKLMQRSGDENRLVYVVSDFRAKEWDNPSQLRQLLSDLEQEDARIHLVNCTRTRRANLAITDLKPTEETRASGVPLFMNVSITNYSDQPAENVQLKVRTYFHAEQEASASGDSRKQPLLPVSKVDESPIIEVDEIEPGGTVTQRVQVFFPEPGKHVVEAILPEDTVAADNRRWCVVEFPEYESVLVIDGDPQQRNAFFIDAIFAPGQRARTGIRPVIESNVYLRDAKPEVLDRYSAIYLCDVASFDDSALANLESYVAGGGGLAIFVGPQVDIDFYNQRLYRDGEGLFPLPLERDDLLAADPLDNSPDIVVEDKSHGVFRELVQGQNPIIRLMHVQRYLRPPSDWSPDAEGDERELARLRSRSPLAVETRYGQGRVVAFMTTYAPYWNDIALGPGVILALRLQSHLGSARRVIAQQQVGREIDARFDGEKYQPTVRVFTPSEDPTTPLSAERTAEPSPEDPRLLRTAILPSETQRSGVYEMWFNRLDGQVDAERYAVNVNPREGDLTQTSIREIVTKLDPVPVEIGYADQYESASIAEAGFNQSLLLMGLLILLLIGEQLLAYATSYHPARRASVTAGAGRVKRWDMSSYGDHQDEQYVQAAVSTTPVTSDLGTAQTAINTPARGAES